MDQVFKIITPTYNSEEWISRCVKSTLHQSYKNFEHIIIDDASTDGTVKEALKAAEHDPRYKIVCSKKRRGALYNHCLGIDLSKADPEDVIIHLDGDDLFYDSEVLDRVNKAYKDENCWVTYGNYVPTDMTDSICAPTVDNNFREKSTWIWAHLRTFKKFLFDEIDREKDFTDYKGEYYSSAADTAIMYPILEMAGKDRIVFIDEPNVIYNRETPFNDDKVDLGNQVRCVSEIRNKEAYGLL